VILLYSTFVTGRTLEAIDLNLPQAAVHPLSNVRRWRAATAESNGKSPVDLKRDAMAAWRRFVYCARSLPPDQAMPLWQAVSVEAAVHIA
jgi:hypothetical protein